jgi:hypothetical protein
MQLKLHPCVLEGENASLHILAADTVTVLSVEVEKARETSQNKSNPNKLMKEVSLENQSNQKR